MADPNNVGRVSVDVAFSKTDIESSFKASTTGLSTVARVTFNPEQIKAAFKIASAGLNLTADVNINQSKVVAEAAAAGKASQLAFNKASNDPALTAAQNRSVLLNQTKLADRVAANQKIYAERAATVEKEQQSRRLTREASHLQDIEKIHLRNSLRLQNISKKPFAAGVISQINQMSTAFSQFNQTTSRVLRFTGLAIAGWSAGVVAAFGATATAAIVSFAKIEAASARAGAVVASSKISDEIVKNGRAVSNFATLATDAQKQIISNANQVALATAFNPAQIIEGTTALLQAGQSLPDALKNIGKAAEFAQVTQTDLVVSSDNLAASLAAAGLSSKDSGKLLDKFAFTAQSTLGNAADTAEAFANRGASSFKAYGRGVDETLTLISLLASAGTTGRPGGVQASIVLRDIAKSAGNNADAFKKHNITIRDATHLNASFNDTLVDLAREFEAAQKAGGDVGVAKLRKELGFMDKSVGSILQIIPKINERGKEGLDGITTGIRDSAGTVETQAEFMRRTIEFQWGNLLDTIGIQFSNFGAAASDNVTKIFDAFAGSGGLVERAAPQIKEFGESFGVFIGKVAEFTKTDNFTNGIKTIAEAIQVTLKGVRDGIRAFSDAFNGPDSPKSAFESFADSILAFSELSARVLPAVGDLIGRAFAFIRDNPEVVGFFAKAAIGVFLLSKALTVVVKPLVTVVGQLGKISKFGAARGGLGGVATRFGLIGGAIAGIVIAGKGLFEGWTDSFQKINTETVDLKNGFDAIKVVFNIITTNIQAMGRAAESIGKFFGGRLADTVVIAEEAFAGFSQILNGDFLDGIKTLGSAFLNSLLTIPKQALASLFDIMADTINTAVGAFKGIPGLGRITKQFDDATEKIHDAASDIRGFQVDFGDVLEGTKKKSDKTKKSIDGVTDSVKNLSGSTSKITGAGKKIRLSLGDIERSVSPLSRQGKMLKDLRAEIKLVHDQAVKGIITPEDATAQLNTLYARGLQLGYVGARSFGKGTVDGIAKEAPKVAPKVAEGVKKMLPAASAAKTSGGAFGFNLLQGLSDAVSAHSVAAKAKVDIGVKNTLPAATSAKSSGSSFGLNLLSGLSDAVEAASGKTQAKVANSVKKSVPKHTDFIGFGKKIGSSLASGFRSAMAGVLSIFSILKEQAAFNARLNRVQSLVGNISKTASLINKSLKNVEKSIKDVGKDTVIGRITAIAAAVNRAYTAILDRYRLFVPRFHAVGQGIVDQLRFGAAAGLPALTEYLGRVVFRVRGIFNTLDDGMQIRGERVMTGLLIGMKRKFGHKGSPEGTIAHYLNIEIPALIQDLKGPVAYDATILVPAGEAIMGGLNRGLHSGFGAVESFLRDVGPSMEEFVPEGVFADATKQFMVDVAMGETPDPYAFFEKFIPEAIGLGGGIVDPSVGFMHRSLSQADTLDMAQSLAKTFGVSITSLDTGKHAPNSYHYQGLAADLSNGSHPTPQMDALYAALKPLQGKVLAELLYKTMTGGNHFNHVHAAWMKGSGFDRWSGKKGAPAVSIPGVGADVLSAISYASSKTGLNPALIAAVMKQESGFRKNVVSFDGGYGLMQLTSQGLVNQADALGGRLDPKANAFVGSKYLSDLISQLGSTSLGLSAYNSGPGGGERSGHVDVPRYVSSVLHFFEEFRKKFGNMGFGGFREHGGPAYAGKAYVVGEKGPELFFPNQSGQVLSNPQSQQMISNNQRSSQIVDNRIINFQTNASDPNAIVDVFDAHFGAAAGRVNTR